MLIINLGACFDGGQSPGVHACYPVCTLLVTLVQLMHIVATDMQLTESLLQLSQKHLDSESGQLGHDMFTFACVGILCWHLQRLLNCAV